MKTLCIDIGATRIKWAVLESVNRLSDLACVRVQTMRTLGWLNPELKNLLDKNNWRAILHHNQGDLKFDRVSIGICAALDGDGRVVGHLLQRGIASDLLASFQRRVTPTPVSLVNDAVAWIRGAVRYAKLACPAHEFPALALIFGTGVGLAVANSFDESRPQEFDGRFDGKHVAEAAEWKGTFNPWDVHRVLGKPFFEWVERDNWRWKYQEVREHFTRRVAALLEDIKRSYVRPRVLFIGGGNAEYVSARRIEEINGVHVLPIRQNELGGLNPDLVPLIGLAG
jgi:hypothetical protein